MFTVINIPLLQYYEIIWNKIFILNDVMNNKLRMRNLGFYRDVAGDSSIMGYYVVYCLILEIQL